MKTITDIGKYQGRQKIETIQFFEKLLKSGKYEDLIKRLEAVLDKNYNVLNSLLLYAFVLEKVDRIDESKKLVERLDKFYNTQQSYTNRGAYGGRNNVFNNPRYFQLKMALLVDEKRYEEAYKYLPDFFRIFKMVHNKMTYYQLDFKEKIFKSKFDYYLNKEKPKNVDMYCINQLFNYNEESLIEHVKDHTFEDSYDEVYESENDYQVSTFNPDINIEDLYKLILENMDKVKPIRQGIFNEVRTFKYERVGIKDYKHCDYIRVCSYKHTNNIITFFPVEDGSNYCYDITPKTLLIDDNKPSRSELFYKKYNLEKRI